MRITELYRILVCNMRMRISAVFVKKKQKVKEKLKFNRLLRLIIKFDRQGKALITATIFFLISAQGVSATAASLSKETLTLHQVADVPLTGNTTRFDYQSDDPKRHLLFIAHLGDSFITVFNTQTKKVAAEIEGVSQVHGVLAIPSLGHVYASATGRNEVVVIDENTLKVIATIPGGEYPDGMAYVPTLQKLYVSDETGGTETVIDAQTNRRVATIRLDGAVGNTQYDAVSGHIYVNVQTQNSLVEIDPTKDQIVGRYPLAGANHNHGLYIEPQRRLAFVACEGNAQLLVVDMRTMKVITSSVVGDDPDVLAFDPGLALLYIASESGVVSIFHLEGSGLKKVWQERIAAHAHTVAVDPETHRVYFPLQNIKGKPLLRIMQWGP